MCVASLSAWSVVAVAAVAVSSRLFFHNVVLELSLFNWSRLLLPLFCVPNSQLLNFMMCVCVSVSVCVPACLALTMTEVARREKLTKNMKERKTEERKESETPRVQTSKTNHKEERRTQETPAQRFTTTRPPPKLLATACRQASGVRVNVAPLTKVQGPRTNGLRSRTLCRGNRSQLGDMRTKLAC